MLLYDAKDSIEVFEAEELCFFQRLYQTYYKQILLQNFIIFVKTFSILNICMSLTCVTIFYIILILLIIATTFRFAAC